MIEGFEMIDIIVDVENCLQAYVGFASDINAVVVVFRGTQENRFYPWTRNNWRKRIKLLSHNGVFRKSWFHHWAQPIGLNHSTLTYMPQQPTNGHRFFGTTIPYHPSSVGSNTIFLGRQPEAIDGAGAVVKAAGGIRRELQHLDSAGLLQVWCCVELGREMYREVAVLIRRSKCRVSDLAVGASCFACYGYLST